MHWAHIDVESVRQPGWQRMSLGVKYTSIIVNQGGYRSYSLADHILAFIHIATTLHACATTIADVHIQPLMHPSRGPCTFRRTFCFVFSQFLSHTCGTPLRCFFLFDTLTKSTNNIPSTKYIHARKHTCICRHVVITL
jgi:hypothetical protein